MGNEGYDNLIRTEAGEIFRPKTLHLEQKEDSMLDSQQVAISIVVSLAGAGALALLLPRGHIARRYKGMSGRQARLFIFSFFFTLTVPLSVGGPDVMSGGSYLPWVGLNVLVFLLWMFLLRIASRARSEHR